MKPLTPNSMIQNRYLIVQLIGKGGMGEVYLAVDQRLGSAVALKRTFFSDDQTLGNAFEREARILGRLRHPVLPKVIDHFIENTEQFLVMEHISGDDISKRLQNSRKPFPLSWVMFWADQMLDALSYLHSHEPPIVHRDIKPQNLKLTDDNHIVLLDFGLSKDFDTTTGGADVNSASVAGYSPHFASMEQIRGTGTDARSDLYSLSATLYQMLANIVPPDALTRADALLGGHTDPLRPLNQLNSEVTPEIADVISKGFSLRQDERFASALEMQKTLRRAFNRDKANPQAKPVMSITNPEQPPADTSAPKPENHAADANGRVEQLESVDATMRVDLGSEINPMKPGESENLVAEAAEIAPVTASDAGSDEVPINLRYPLQVEKVVSPHASTVASQRKPVPGKLIAETAKPDQRSAVGRGTMIGMLAGVVILASVSGGAGWLIYQSLNPTEPPSIISNANVNSSSASSVPAVDPSNSDQSNFNANSNTNAIWGAHNPLSVNQTPTASPRPAGQIPAKTSGSRTGPPSDSKSKQKPKSKDDRTVIMP